MPVLYRNGFLSDANAVCDRLVISILNRIEYKLIEPICPSLAGTDTDGVTCFRSPGPISRRHSGVCCHRGNGDDVTRRACPDAACEWHHQPSVIIMSRIYQPQLLIHWFTAFIHIHSHSYKNKLTDPPPATKHIGLDDWSVELSSNIPLISGTFFPTWD